MVHPQQSKTWLEQLKIWRATHANNVSEWAALQKEASINRDFEAAKYYGSCKKDSLRALDWLEPDIKFEQDEITLLDMIEQKDKMLKAWHPDTDKLGNQLEFQF